MERSVGAGACHVVGSWVRHDVVSDSSRFDRTSQVESLSPPPPLCVYDLSASAPTAVLAVTQSTGMRPVRPGFGGRRKDKRHLTF